MIKGQDKKSTYTKWCLQLVLLNKKYLFINSPASRKLLFVSGLFFTLWSFYISRQTSSFLVFLLIYFLVLLSDLLLSEALLLSYSLGPPGAVWVHLESDWFYSKIDFWNMFLWILLITFFKKNFFVFLSFSEFSNFWMFLNFWRIRLLVLSSFLDQSWKEMSILQLMDFFSLVKIFFTCLIFEKKICTPCLTNLSNPLRPRLFVKK